MKIFLLFTIVYPNINMNAVETILPVIIYQHIRENRDFLRQMPWQMMSAKAKLKGFLLLLNSCYEDEFPFP